MEIYIFFIIFVIITRELYNDLSGIFIFPFCFSYEKHPRIFEKLRTKDDITRVKMKWYNIVRTIEDFH